MSAELIPRSLTLFSHGIATLSLRSTVTDSATLSLTIPKRHINDLLKSLTVVDQADGTIASISYPAPHHTPPSNFSIDNSSAIHSLLRRTQGAHVTISYASQVTHSGKILGIQNFHDQSTNTAGEVTATSDEHIILLEDDFSVTHHKILSTARVVYTDPSLQKLLLRTLIASTDMLQGEDSKQILIRAEGEGERDVVASYVVESPVYKFTYRFLLQGDKVFVQAWAIIDNPCECDLDDIDVTIVSGMPISFKHDLYTSRFMQRPEEEVNLRVGIKPPSQATFGSGMKMLKKRAAVSPAVGRSGAGGFGGSLFQVMEEEVSFDMAFDDSEHSDKDDSQGLPLAKPFSDSNTPSAETSDVGDLFEYHIPNKVTIKARESALVPLINQLVDGGRVDIFSHNVMKANTLSSVRIKNITHATFEAGPVSVFEKTRLVGEGMMKACRPGAEQFMPYGVNLDCTAEMIIDHRTGQVLTSIAVRGSISTKRYHDVVTKYIFRNSKTECIDLYVLHQLDTVYSLKCANVKVSQAVEGGESNISLENGEVDISPVDSQHGVARYRFSLPPGSETALYVTERRQIETSVRIQNCCKSHKITLMLKQGVITNEMAKRMHEIMKVQEEMAEEHKNISKLGKRANQLEKNQDRFRNNLQALGGLHDSTKFKDHPLIMQYIQGLGDSETEIQENQSKVESAYEQVRELESKIEEMLLSFEKIDNM